MTIHKTLSSVHISFARVSSCLYVCALSSFFLERLRAFIRVLCVFCGRGLGLATITMFQWSCEGMNIIIMFLESGYDMLLTSSSSATHEYENLRCSIHRSCANSH